MSDNIFYFTKDDATINKDGSINISGKKSDGTIINIKCSAQDLCTATLKPNNKNSKISTTTNFFKLTDIPNVMESKGWVQAAFLQRKWFNDSNLEMTLSDKRGGWGNSNPKLDYYNPSRFNHEWLSKFPRYNQALNNLIANLLTEKSKKVIIKSLKKLSFSPFNFEDSDTYEFSSSYYRGADIELLKSFHRDWQIQREAIDNSFPAKSATYISNSLNIDDLWAAFGAFNIYASIGDYSVSYIKSNDSYKINIKSIYCYAIDSYDFIIDGNKGKGDYLGHWNKNDMTFSLYDKDDIKNSMMTVVVDDTGTTEKYFIPEKLFFPIFNQHYQLYRKKHNKGKDMVIWTKPHLIKLESNKNSFFQISKKEVDKILGG
ncbi:Uncharacterised protein [Moraxella lacunata]|uniref:Uncharacterized protein n=2 Tax=Moraxella lacunata TaxID=477 RepID=A0A378TPS8_MORLA|nr:DUF6402 family protein [Moraxella lacunata]STZ62727.1 Uncharacterised protein [Moraxella lacunata]